MVLEKIRYFLVNVLDGLFSFIVYPVVVIKIDKHKLKRKISWGKEDIKFCTNNLDFYKRNPDEASAIILKYKVPYGLFNPNNSDIHINLSHHETNEQIINTIIHECLHKEISKISSDARNNLYDLGEEKIVRKMVANS